MKFGFFDSGLGRLFVMEKVSLLHPQYDYVFLGDTKNLPYGPRTSEEIAVLIEPHLLHLVESEKCDHVVVACNTASVRALPIFFEKYPQYKEKIHRIDIPTIQALSERNIHSLLILATEQTVNSEAYQDLEKYGISITSIAMPGLVEYIELQDHRAAMHVCNSVLVKQKQEQKVLLACTHYLWLIPFLEKEYQDMEFIGQDSIVAEYVQRLARNINRDLGQEGETEKQGIKKYFVSGNNDEYSRRHQRDFTKIDFY